MHALMNAYRTLREGGALAEAHCRDVLAEDARPFQLASLATRLLARESLAPHEAALVARIVETPGTGAPYLRVVFPGHVLLAGVASDADPARAGVLRGTHAASTLGAGMIHDFVQRFTNDEVPLEVMAIWLMTVCVRGLSEDDTRHLALAMRDSGRTYDYRGLPELGGAKVIRRYPTGALSEKAALILPALLASARDRFPIASPFLVARSLGHTGGTWDKLKAIPGFTFPDPGDASIAALRACGVAMIVTQGDACPADRKMYAFRSTTGTIESHPLLLSSIASKQLAMPADHLLMDVRYGAAAFCETRAAGERLGADIARLLALEGLACSVQLTDTLQPGGSSVGNALEVLEALAVMSPSPPPGWDARALDDQRALVLQFFGLLLSRTFPDASYLSCVELGAERLASGRVLESFLEILAAHGVDESTRAAIVRDPWGVVGPSGEPAAVRAEGAGALKSIDQHRLGFIVNFAFGGGGNEYGCAFDPRAGVLLRKRIGDAVLPGDELCAAYLGARSDVDVQRVVQDLRACFVVA